MRNGEAIVLVLALAACSSNAVPSVLDAGDMTVSSGANDLAIAMLSQPCAPDPGSFESANGSRGNCAVGLLCCPWGCPPNPDAGPYPCDPIALCEAPVGASLSSCPPQ